MFTVMFDMLSKSLYLIIYIGFKEGNVLFNDTTHFKWKVTRSRLFIIDANFNSIEYT